MLAHSSTFGSDLLLRAGVSWLTGRLPGTTSGTPSTVGRRRGRGEKSPSTRKGDLHAEAPKQVEPEPRDPPPARGAPAPLGPGWPGAAGKRGADLRPLRQQSLLQR